jgi:Coenzyme PQQ synthesis protein D (PqqD)
MGDNAVMSGDQGVVGWSVARRRDLLWRRTATQVIVLEPGAGHLVVLEGDGVDLWDLLSYRRDVSDVISALAERNGAATAAIASDVFSALRDLSARGLLDSDPEG